MYNMTYAFCLFSSMCQPAKKRLVVNCNVKAQEQRQTKRLFTVKYCLLSIIIYVSGDRCRYNAKTSYCCLLLLLVRGGIRLTYFYVYYLYCNTTDSLKNHITCGKQ